MKKDFVMTFITELFILVISIIVYRMAADMLGKEGFSEYALCRRTTYFIYPLLFMGLGVGIPRYIAFSQTGSDRRNPDGYFISGIAVLFLSALLFTATANLLKNELAFLIFGKGSYSHLVFPVNLMLLGLLLHSACYSYFRGKLFMFKANLLQILNLGIALPCAFFIGSTTEEILIFTGVIWLSVSLLFLFSIMSQIKWKVNIISNTRELLSYGLRRVPGDFGLSALLSLPAVITAHISGVTEAGSIAFGLSLFNLSGKAFAPVGLILLPKASQLISSNNFSILRQQTLKILKIICALTFIGVICYEILADKIIAMYLGSSFSDIVLVTRIIMIGGIPFAIYVSMRSIIDAYYIRAVNTVHILYSLLLFLITSGFIILNKDMHIHIISCFVLSIFLLGGLTLFEIRNILRKHVSTRKKGRGQSAHIAE